MKAAHRKMEVAHEVDYATAVGILGSPTPLVIADPMLADGALERSGVDLKGRRLLGRRRGRAKGDGRRAYPVRARLEP